jgi:putative transposase
VGAPRLALFETWGFSSEPVPFRHIWQAHFYDFNIWTDRKRIEKLQYMHRNPVRRGLVDSPETWRWSSYRSYALGECGLVRLNDWGTLQVRVRTPVD